MYHYGRLEIERARYRDEQQLVELARLTMRMQRDPRCKIVKSMQQMENSALKSQSYCVCGHKLRRTKMQQPNELIEQRLLLLLLLLADERPLNLPQSIN